MGNIKNKIIFGVIFAAVSSAMIISLLFLVQKGKSNSLTAELKESVPEPINESQSEGQPQNEQKEKEAGLPTLLETPFFILTLPAGWEQTSVGNDLPIVVMNMAEKVVNEKVKEMNFKTGLSINGTKLGDMLFQDYIDSLKTNLVDSISVIDIKREWADYLNYRDVRFLEIHSVQHDIEFATLLAFIVDEQNIVWAFSFNTLEESWPAYKDNFQKIFKGLRMKDEPKDDK